MTYKMMMGLNKMHKPLTLFVARIARGARAYPALCPDAGQGPLLTNPCLVLEPYLQRLSLRPVWQGFRNQSGKVFLERVSVFQIQDSHTGFDVTPCLEADMGVTNGQATSNRVVDCHVTMIP